MSKRILYVHSVNSTFVRKDVELLEKHYEVSKFFFNPTPKWLVPWQFLSQFIFLMRRMRKTDLVITQFGGYQSYLSGLIAGWFKKPSLIILGGSDCVSFPSIHYGNFNKKVLGLITRWSYQRATHLSPVHKSLVEGPYTYTDDDFPAQGYRVFCPKVTAGFTELRYGYDHSLFTASEAPKPNSFLTVGFLNHANYYRKGVDLMLQLAERMPESTFTIVGGTLDDIPVDSAPSNVTFIRSVKHAELKELYASHEFYLQLSICEGFPSAICEAMLCESIPIGSDVAAIPEIIGEAGYVLKKKSMVDLEVLVQKAMSDPNKRELSKAARDHIMKMCPIDERKKLITLCEKLMD